MADLENIDLLVQYTISTAAREEHPDNQLGQLHVLAYIYLADLAHSQKRGETFTGAAWCFDRFGPWSELVQGRIEPAVRAVGLERLDPSEQPDELVRYAARSSKLRDALEPRLPLLVSRAVDKVVRRYGSDTAHLLEAVYRTAPIKRAAPGEALSFDDVAPLPPPAPDLVLTARQQKFRRQKLAAIKAKVRDRSAQRGPSPSTPPRYDDVFERGVACLDQRAPAPVVARALDLTFDDSIWKSEFRRNDELP